MIVIALYLSYTCIFNIIGVGMFAFTVWVNKQAVHDYLVFKGWVEVPGEHNGKPIRMFEHPKTKVVYLPNKAIEEQFREEMGK
jgi:hypothetical protein